MCIRDSTLILPLPQVHPHIAITKGTPSYCHHHRYIFIFAITTGISSYCHHHRSFFILPSPQSLLHTAITTGPSSYCHHRRSFFILPLLHDRLHTAAITTDPSSYCHHHRSFFILPSPQVLLHTAITTCPSSYCHIWVLLPWCTLPLRLHSPFFHPVTSKQQDRLHDFGQGSLAVQHQSSTRKCATPQLVPGKIGCVVSSVSAH